jgi:hypothetical protein
VKHFYQAQAISEDPTANLSSFHPGFISIKPVWVYEPGKVKEGEKGATITLITYYYWSGEGEFSHKVGGDERTAFLDLKELRDLDTSLDFFQSDSSPWRAQEKSDHVEVSFDSKDDFQASIFHTSGDRGDVLFLTIAGKSIELNTAKASELQKITRDAIGVLDKL